MNIKKITGQELDRIITESVGQFVAIFSTDWCGYCRALKKEIEAVTLDFRIVEVDISDESDSSWERFEINLVPTALLFENGKEISRKEPRAGRLDLKSIKELACRRF